MLEPLIALTVLNCIFMFSSTVTTCALWWQYQTHHCRARKNAARQKSDLKRSRSNYILQNAKKPGQSNVGVKKSSANVNRDRKCRGCRKRRSKKNLEHPTIYERKNGEKISPLNGSSATNFEKNTRTSEASQTVNNTKSTVVMEFSTVQKVVQILDNDCDVNPARAPFREIVIQKDAADKKYDYNVEQNFSSNAAAGEKS